MGYREVPTSAVVFDIETKRHSEFKTIMGIDVKLAHLDDMDFQDLIDFAAENEIKLGNRNKIESIHPYLKDALNKEANRAALKMYGCEICAIGVGGINSPKVVAWVTDVDHSEEEVIRHFISAIQNRQPLLVGFNIKDFDIPLLRARCLALGIPWPDFLPQTKDDRYSNSVFDLRDVLYEGSLDVWLRMLKLPPKTAHGSDVERMTPQERRQYVADDVERERRLARLVMRNHNQLATLVEDDE